MMYVELSLQAQSATEAAQQARDQAQAMREQAQAMREQIRAEIDAARARQQQGVVNVPPPYFRGVTRRQEGLLFGAFLVGTMACVAIFYPLMRALGKRLEGSPAPRDPLLTKGSAERLERIEQAVEAMAIEIERISEGQRFTTKLLAERMPLTLPAER